MNPTPQNPLATLKDIHLPPEPGWWPPAPGWWIVTLSLLTLIGFGIYKWRQRQLRLRPIKLALIELSQLDLKTTNSTQQSLALQELSALVRRFCIVFFPEQAIAGLCGQAWLEFLKQEISGKNAGQSHQLSDNDLQPLLEETYSPTCNADLVALGRIVEQWFKAQQKKKTGVRP